MRIDINCSHRRAALVLGLILGAGSAAWADAVALVCQVSGPVSRVGAPAPVSPMSELNRGSRLHLGKGSSLVVALYGNGKRFELVGPTNATVTADAVAAEGTSLREINPKTVGTGLNRPVSGVLGALVERSVALPEFHMVPPVSDQQGPRPEFRWTPRPNLTQFKVTISLEKDGSRETLVTGVADKTEWRYPDSAPELKPGANYLIEVRSNDDYSTTPITSALFHVLSAEQRSQIQSLEEQANQDPTLWPLVVTHYVQLRLYSDALRHLNLIEGPPSKGASGVTDKSEPQSDFAVLKNKLLNPSEK